MLEIILHFGYKNQLKKLNEECYELIEAILENNREHITEEIADRLNKIMVERDKLYMEYSQILEELCKRLPNLKDNEDLKLKKIKGF